MDGPKRDNEPSETAELLTDDGGETSCYAHLLCLECGAVLDGGRHRDGCGSALTTEVTIDALK